jgi:hypothetical protein
MVVSKDVHLLRSSDQPPQVAWCIEHGTWEVPEALDLPAMLTAIRYWSHIHIAFLTGFSTE